MPPPSLYHPGLERVSTLRALSLFNAISLLLHMPRRTDRAVGRETSRRSLCRPSADSTSVLASVLLRRNEAARDDLLRPTNASMSRKNLGLTGDTGNKSQNFHIQGKSGCKHIHHT